MCQQCLYKSRGAQDIAAQARLETLLQLNPLLNRFDLKVQVQQGLATLDGVVDHPALKQLACEIARQGAGVEQVRDGVRVEAGKLAIQQRHPLAQTLRDLNTRAVIRLKYQLNRYTVDQLLEVDVCNDVAKIVGRVSHARATDFARQLAQDTVGISAVETQVEVCDDLPLKPRDRGQSLERISADAGVMLALTRDLATLPLQVEVQQRTALLFGCVHTDSQLRKAEQLVGAVIGVVGVDSRAVQRGTF